MRIAGFSAAMGSWKIIAMRLPRNWRNRPHRGANIIAKKVDHAFGMPQPLGVVAHDRRRQHRFTGAGLTDHAEDFALAHLQADALHRMAAVGAGGQFDGQVLYPQHLCVVHAQVLAPFWACSSSRPPTGSGPASGWRWRCTERSPGAGRQWPWRVHR
ncbi:hypothetical protein DdX_22070 [Ditylenchus destructor]|uniref:Uncharacterized protein n=1 Tax=Ditylenchus destructor TaxID=166010 RepID=A0AAD4MGA9_9BILA|nr:hypothetical protein DdX_22070 [Ditylenchus destructor]